MRVLMPRRFSAMHLMLCCWLVFLGCWLLPPGLQLAKAQLAQELIPSAWGKTLATGSIHKPWSWADTWPVAKLSTPDGQDLYVLANGTGQSLAFGPSMLPNSVEPGANGTVAIAAHRDSHFRFLEWAQAGDVFELQRENGSSKQYRVTYAEIVDSDRSQIMFQRSFDELKLVTCYPFDALAPGGPLRYVVNAVAI